MASGNDLSIRIKAILDATEQEISSQLQKIQSIVSKQSPIDLSVRLNEKTINGIKASTQKVKDTINSISAKGFTDSFGIDDKQTLRDLTKLAMDYKGAIDEISKKRISNDLFSGIIKAVKTFGIDLGEVDKEYKDFIDYVNKSQIKMKPFGSSKDYESMRKSIGIKNVSSKSGLPMDSWYAEARGQFGYLLPDVDSIEDQFEAVYNLLRTSKEKLRDARVTGEEAIDLSGGRDEIKNQLDLFLNELSTVENKMQEATKPILKYSSSMFSDKEGFESAQRRIEEIKNSVDELATMKVSTSLNDDGDMEIVKAVMEYKNEAGDAIQETMRWKTSVSELGEEFKTFMTTNVGYVDSIEKQKQVSDSLAANQKKVLNDISLATSKAFDNTTKPIKLDENISLVNLKAQELQKTVNSIFDNAKNGNRGLLKSESAEIDNLIKNYKNLISTIQTQERAANKLRTDTVADAMGKEPASLSQIESRMKLNKVATEDLVATLEKLKASIAGIKTKEQFIDYSVEKDKLKAQINAEIDAQRVVNAQNRESESVASFIKTYQEKIRVLREGNTSAILNNDGLNKELDGFIAKLNSLDNNNGTKKLAQEFKVIEDNIRLAKQDFNLDVQIDKANIKIDEFLTKFSAVKGNPALMSQLSELQGRLETIRQTGDAVGFKTWQKDWQAFGVEVEESGKKTKSFGDQLKDAANKFGLWITASTIMMQFSRAVENGIRSVVELDKSMTDLRMVTGWSGQQVKENVVYYNQLAKSIGISTKEVLESADGFLRQGKTVEETNKLIEDTSMFARVAQLDGAEATEIATVALNAYKKEASDAMSIFDKFNAVDLVAASSAAEIGTSFKYVGATAAEVGISIDKLVGLLTVGSEQTRLSAETIGNTWRTLSTRMSNVKIGKFEGMEDSTDMEALNDTERVLNKVGIALRDTNGIWKDQEVVIDEVGRRWEEFTQTEQNAVSTAMAGTRQANIFRATMSSYADVLEYTAVAQESAGTTLEKFGVIQDSIDYKVNQFKETTVGMWQSLVDTDVIKFVVDLGTGFIKTIEAISPALNSWPVQAGLATAAIKLLMGSFKTDTIFKFFQGLAKPKFAGFIFRKLAEVS